MSQDPQIALEKLRAELAFIESGGYRNPARAQWRPQFIFEDSPTCINHDPTKPRRPCRECALAEFVPVGFEKKRFPCRYIPLNECSETVDSLYRTGTQEELETAIVKWLKGTIKRLETGTYASAVERGTTGDPCEGKVHVGGIVPIRRESASMFSVCANPDCRVAFDYQQGRFFRFHKDHAAGEDAPNLHSVQHFWLCGECCLEFTLEYQDGAGVLIKNRPDVVSEVELSRFIAAA